jgi:hypothetical protein
MEERPLVLLTFTTRPVCVLVNKNNQAAMNEQRITSTPAQHYLGHTVIADQREKCVTDSQCAKEVCLDRGMGDLFIQLWALDCNRRIIHQNVDSYSDNVRNSGSTTSDLHIVPPNFSATNPRNSAMLAGSSKSNRATTGTWP